MLDILFYTIIPTVIAIILILKLAIKTETISTDPSNKDQNAMEKTGRHVSKFMVFIFILAAGIHALCIAQLASQFSSGFFVFIVGALLSFPIYGSAMVIIGLYSAVKVITTKNKPED